ncbi:hypothetical protein KAU33_05640 [Candidatus Dependentiae bacterium]|nr:hypothetical protein [Candidatus Dependentiae bacterium]
MRKETKKIIAACIIIVIIGSVILIRVIKNYHDPEKQMEWIHSFIIYFSYIMLFLIIFQLTVVPFYKHVIKKTIHFYKGNKLFNQGKYEAAYNEYLKSNASKKRRERCRLLTLEMKKKQAKQAEESGDYWKAMSLYEELGQTGDFERVKKINHEKTLNQAKLYEKNGELDKALILYRKLDIEEDILRIEKKLME